MQSPSQRHNSMVFSRKYIPSMEIYWCLSVGTRKTCVTLGLRRATTLIMSRPRLLPIFSISNGDAGQTTPPSPFTDTSSSALALSASAASAGTPHTDLTSLPSDVSKLSLGLLLQRSLRLRNPQPFLRGRIPTAQRWMIYPVLRMHSTHSSSLKWWSRRNTAIVMTLRSASLAVM
jgi:hypothetical protein